MLTKIVRVTQEIMVTVDETKFDEEFLVEFRESFYQFHTIEDHLQHLAQLYARGLVDNTFDSFIEGYGEAKDFGIEFKQVYGEEEIV